MFDISILYEDSDILAVNKPAGLGVHRDGFSTEPALTDWLLTKYPDIKDVGEPMMTQKGEKIDKPGIVHRLDKDTSGVLLVAKNQPAYLALKKQFQEHLIKKTYRLIVYGNIISADGAKEGKIDLAIGRTRQDPQQRLAGFGATGELREALTYYQVLKNYSGFAYVEAHPQTGRTHQLRVHFKAINHPIVCDALYAPKQPCLPGLARQALHAFKLDFTLPSGGAKSLEAPLPEDFKEALGSLESKS